MSAGTEDFAGKVAAVEGVLGAEKAVRQRVLESALEEG